MKLLSVSLPNHDANVSYFDGQTVRYLKLERVKQIKRFHYENLSSWKQDVETLFNIDVNSLDDVVLTFDPGSFPTNLRQSFSVRQLGNLVSDVSKAEKMPFEICRYLGIKSSWFISHHWSHALSAWMLEKSSPDVHIVIDGLGDGRPWSVYRNERLIAAGDIRNGSIGWGIRDAGRLLGIQYGHYNDIAGKVMGLQSFGKIDTGFMSCLDRFGFHQIKDIWSVDHWYTYKRDRLVGQLTLLDWIATVHFKTGRLIVEFMRGMAGPEDTISYSGGVAQNVVWNSMIKEAFPNLVIPPHSSDEGLSLGGLEWLRRHHGLAPLSFPHFPYGQTDEAVPSPSHETIDKAAQLLAQGKTVGWYQSHGEVGPRALGARSILMDPRISNGKTKINRIKKREAFRPFGASILKEHFTRYFSGHADPFMLFTAKTLAAELDSITHVDGTSRVQCVDESVPNFQKLLNSFFSKTGCPVLLNTSLNIAGKPLANAPDVAMEFFHTTDLDSMVIGDRVFLK